MIHISAAPPDALNGDVYLDVYCVKGVVTAETYDASKDDSGPIAMVCLDADGIDRLIKALAEAKTMTTM